MASRAVGTAGSPGQGSCFPQLSSSLQQGKQQGFTPPLPSLVTNICLKLSTSLNPGTGSSLGASNTTLVIIGAIKACPRLGSAPSITSAAKAGCPVRGVNGLLVLVVQWPLGPFPALPRLPVLPLTAGVWVWVRILHFCCTNPGGGRASPPLHPCPAEPKVPGDGEVPAGSTTVGMDSKALSSAPCPLRTSPCPKGVPRAGQEPGVPQP